MKVKNLLLIICAALLLAGCAEKRTNENEEYPHSTLSGRIAVSSREEQYAAEKATQTLFWALENKDAETIRNMFSPYAQEHAVNLDADIQRLIAYYPGADGEYEGAACTFESNRYGVKEYSMDILLSVNDEGMEYRYSICLYLRNDTDTSKEGVHLIEAIREEEMSSDFFWKEPDDPPGIYVWE